MKRSLITDIEQFVVDAGLSEHRAGILLVNNGRLIERLRANRRIWPETERKVRTAIARERKKRGLPSG